jgi:hypothetical protein
LLVRILYRVVETEAIDALPTAIDDLNAPALDLDHEQTLTGVKQDEVSFTITLLTSSPRLPAHVM